jgi:TonB-dependent receptor
MRKAIYAVLLWALGALGAANANAGTIQGVIKDDRSGERLIGANVLVMGTSIGAVTDLDGNFVLNKVPDGTYNVRVTCMSYSGKVITGVVVDGDNATKVTITLDPLDLAGQGDATRIEDTYVTAERVRNTNIAILAARQKAAVIGDGISAEQISRSPDATSSDALKRVTGLSVVDNKYVFIRGVTDRYNTTALNGVSVTGSDTDADKKSFAFDLIPSSLISSTVVQKTATPDLPGDFAGGRVEVNTLEFPPRRLVSAKIGSSYNVETTGEARFVAQGSGTDWRAKDDGLRALPYPVDGVDFGVKTNGYELAKALPNTWGVKATPTNDIVTLGGISGDSAPPNGSYQLSMGDRFSFGDQEMGFIGALTYSRGYDVQDFSIAPQQLNETTGQIEPGAEFFFYDGKRFKTSVLWGGLFNASYKPTQNHKFSAKNTYSRSASEQVQVSYGENTNRAPLWRESIEWNERFNYTGEVSGEHTLRGLNDLEVEWSAGLQDSKAEQPDRRYVEYNEKISYDIFTGAFDTTFSHKDNLRSWSAMEDNSNSYDVDLTYPLNRRTKLKGGAYKYSRERAFSIDNFSAVAKNNGLADAAREVFPLPPGEIFNGDNFGPEKWQLDFIRTSAFTGEYRAEQDLFAWYVMGDRVQDILGQRFRAVGGVRVEDSDQTVFTEEAEDIDNTLETGVDKRDVLPSANLSWMATDNINLRFAFSESVNRPEFRELSPVTFYDFNREENVIGNPNLERAEIKNYDVRLEWFPHVGEVIALSYFYKDFANAIQTTFQPASATRPRRSWTNSPEAYARGYEIEVRKSLGFVPWDYMNNFTVMANYTDIESEADQARVGNGGNFFEKGPMQGQSPWMINLALYFNEPKLGTSLSVLYNKIGRRLDTAGQKDWLDVYEEPRSVVDFAWNQQLWYGSKLKFVVKDIIADDVVFTSVNDKTKHSQYSKGTSYSLSLSFSL